MQASERAKAEEQKAEVQGPNRPRGSNDPVATPRTRAHPVAGAEYDETRDISQDAKYRWPTVGVRPEGTDPIDSGVLAGDMFDRPKFERDLVDNDPLHDRDRNLKPNYQENDEQQAEARRRFEQRARLRGEVTSEQADRGDAVPGTKPKEEQPKTE